MSWEIELLEKSKLAKEASAKLNILSTYVKDQTLAKMAQFLMENKNEILEANSKDIQRAKLAGMKEALVDRLLLTEARVEGMANGLLQVKSLPDPIGEILSGGKRPNGMEITKIRVPFGVVGIVYESRPNVTADAAGLCLKTGNAVILRGGSDAIESNKVIVKILKKAIAESGLPEGTLNLIEDTDREAVKGLLRMNQYVDVIIPPGGSGLI